MTIQSTVKSWVLDRLYTKTPKHLAENFLTTNYDCHTRVEASLREHYFSTPTHRMHMPVQDYLDSAEGRKDLDDHLLGRLQSDRQRVVPWLDSCKSLHGARILEVGVGTGSATVALAEQGAIVSGLDVDPNSLAVAIDRVDAYGLTASLREGNVTECKGLFSGLKFDMVILYAALEHMTHEERLAGIKQSWDLLVDNGMLCVIETPNRLSPFDGHTAHLPFFHWLPDQLAYEYFPASPRTVLKNVFKNRPWDPTSKLDFLRMGRGVSFHEFELGLDNFAEVEVVSCLAGYWRSKSILWRIKWRLSLNGRFAKYLRKLAPDIDPAFFEPDLNIVLRK